jgi:hypothetical protein
LGLPPPARTPTPSPGLIERIAEGENILSVLASAAERGLTRDELLRLPRAEEEEGEEGAAE